MQTRFATHMSVLSRLHAERGVIILRVLPKPRPGSSYWNSTTTTIPTSQSGTLKIRARRVILSRQSKPATRKARLSEASPCTRRERKRQGASQRRVRTQVRSTLSNAPSLVARLTRSHPSVDYDWIANALRDSSMLGRPPEATCLRRSS